MALIIRRKPAPAIGKIQSLSAYNFTKAENSSVKKMMHMTFYWGRRVTILFDSWKTNSWTSYFLSLLACFLISVFYQYMEDRRHRFKLLSKQKPDVYFGGTDTSSATIIWTMAELIRNPTVMQKAQQEVREIDKAQPKIEEGDFPKLTYLKLVIKESFRLHPPAPLMVPRETTDKCTIDDKYEIPAKTRVLFNATAIQTDPKYWKDPDKFLPERFLGSQIDFRGQNFELLPFGVGRRGCPGINFAIPLVELALANFLFAFDWKLPHGMSPEDLNMEQALGVIMHKKIPLCLVASPPNV